MTNTEVANLLVAYGDALEAVHTLREAVHPLPEERTPGPQDQMVSPLANYDPDAAVSIDVFDIQDMRQDPKSRRALILGIAAGIVLLAVVSVRVLSGEAEVRTADGFAPSTFVFPGEVVLRTDPLVVVAARPPEPSFDTSELGTRIEYGSILDLAEADREVVIEDLIERVDDPFGSEEEPIGVNPRIRKISVLGLDLDRPVAVDDYFGVVATAIVDYSATGEPDFWPVGSTLRVTSVMEGEGAGGGFGPIDDPNNPLLLRPPATVEEDRIKYGDFGYPAVSGSSVGEVVGVATIEVEVALEVSVVQLIVDGEPSTWTVPIDGQAILNGVFGERTPLEIVAYGVTGEVLARNKTTASQ